MFFCPLAKEFMSSNQFYWSMQQYCVAWVGECNAIVSYEEDGYIVGEKVQNMIYCAFHIDSYTTINY